MAENEHHIDITAESRGEKQCSVFKLPSYITSLSTDAFKPIVISFGPYHYKEEKLERMEARKIGTFCGFLKINGKTREDVVRSFKSIEQKLMRHYEELDDKWRHGDCFLELMIRDGCFMLDILKATTGLADANKPVSTDIEMIRRDMLLIENQLPLLVLEKLISDNKEALQFLKVENREDWKKVEEGRNTEKEFIHKQIHKHISNFFGLNVMKIKSHNVLCLHALDVLRENIIQGPIQRRVPTGAWAEPGTAKEFKFVTSPRNSLFHHWTGVDRARAKFPAKALRYTGVHFERKDTFSLMDITFDFENKVLTLPYIIMDEETETRFLNLLAFERFQTGKAKEVSAYIDFMASLVHSAEDVNLLHSMHIIESSFESDMEIVALFHKLAKNQIVDPGDSLHEVKKSLVDHYSSNSRRGRCNERLARWRSNFKHTYCNTPWTVIGLLAGIILLMLTVTETIYTVLSYYKKDH